MTREEAIDLVRQYQALCMAAGVEDPTLRDIADRWPDDGSERKAMRWLGFMQGALYAKGLVSLDGIKAHSKDRHVPMPGDPVRRLLANLAARNTDCGSVGHALAELEAIHTDLLNANIAGEAQENIANRVEGVIEELERVQATESGSHADRIAEIEAESDAKHEAAMRELEDIRRNRAALRDTECRSIAEAVREALDGLEDEAEKIANKATDATAPSWRHVFQGESDGIRTAVGVVRFALAHGKVEVQATEQESVDRGVTRAEILAHADVIEAGECDSEAWQEVAAADLRTIAATPWSSVATADPKPGPLDPLADMDPETLRVLVEDAVREAAPILEANKGVFDGTVSEETWRRVIKGYLRRTTEEKPKGQGGDDG